ncbi:MAG: MBL fold metallo-hydrolase [Hyphomicrobiaceae bacterium]
MKLEILGCGDAFGSGGRLQTCFHLEGAGRSVLIDCGASALIGIARAGIDPDAIETVVISHLHGDHFAGLVFLLLQAQHVTRRSRPLTLIGPVGFETRLRAASEALFPGSTEKPLRFPVSFIEFAEGDRLEHQGLTIEAFAGRHPSGALSAALRLELGGRVVAFSGDSEWVDALADCARGADVFLCECYAAEPGVRYHIDWPTLRERLPQLTAQRIVLTHMNRTMLACDTSGIDPRLIRAEDGLVIDLDAPRA